MLKRKIQTQEGVKVKTINRENYNRKIKTFQFYKEKSTKKTLKENSMGKILRFGFSSRTITQKEKLNFLLKKKHQKI